MPALPEVIEQLILDFRPTQRSLLEGFLAVVEDKHQLGRDNHWGCQKIQYENIPGVTIEFLLQRGQLVRAFVGSTPSANGPSGCVKVSVVNYQGLLDFLDTDMFGNRVDRMSSCV